MYNQKPLLGTLPNYAHPLTPTAAWIMNEGSGNKIYDLINGSVGTITGAMWTADNIKFVADSSQYIAIPSNFSGLFSNEATLIIYLKIVSNTPPIGGRTGLETFYISGQVTHYPWTSGDIYLATFRNNRLGPISNGGFDKTEWHQIAITTKPGTNNYKFYQNEKLVFSGDGLSSIYLPTTSYIGRSAATVYFDGNIKFAFLYNRYLLATEIAQLSAGPYCWLAESMGAELIYAAPPVGVMSPYYYETLMAGAVV